MDFNITAEGLSPPSPLCVGLIDFTTEQEGHGEEGIKNSPDEPTAHGVMEEGSQVPSKKEFDELWSMDSVDKGGVALIEDEKFDFGISDDYLDISFGSVGGGDTSQGNESNILDEWIFPRKAQISSKTTPPSSNGLELDVRADPRQVQETVDHSSDEIESDAHTNVELPSDGHSSLLEKNTILSRFAAESRSPKDNLLPLTRGATLSSPNSSISTYSEESCVISVNNSCLATGSEADAEEITTMDNIDLAPTSIVSSVASVTDRQRVAGTKVRETATSKCGIPRFKPKSKLPKIIPKTSSKAVATLKTTLLPSRAPTFTKPQQPKTLASAGTTGRGRTEKHDGDTIAQRLKQTKPPAAMPRNNNNNRDVPIHPRTVLCSKENEKGDPSLLSTFKSCLTPPRSDTKDDMVCGRTFTKERATKESGGLATTKERATTKESGGLATTKERGVIATTKESRGLATTKESRGLATTKERGVIATTKERGGKDIGRTVTKEKGHRKSIGVLTPSRIIHVTPKICTKLNMSVIGDRTSTMEMVNYFHGGLLAESSGPPQDAESAGFGLDMVTPKSRIGRRSLIPTPNPCGQRKDKNPCDHFDMGMSPQLENDSKCKLNDESLAVPRLKPLLADEPRLQQNTTSSIPKPESKRGIVANKPKESGLRKPTQLQRNVVGKGDAAMKNRRAFRPVNGVLRQAKDEGLTKPAYSSYSSYDVENDISALPQKAKVLHSPLDKENQTNTPRSKWSPIKKDKPSCFQCTKRFK